MRKANAELTAADYARKDGDEEGNGELDEIGHVLWEHHGAIYRTYDAYAAIGAKAIGGGLELLTLPRKEEPSSPSHTKCSPMLCVISVLKVGWASMVSSSLCRYA